MAKYVRTFLKGNDATRWIDWPAPGGIAQFMLGVTMQGCIMPMTKEGIAVWVPLSEIRFAVEIEAAAPASMFLVPGDPSKPN